MEALLREAKEKHSEIPASLKEQIVLEHTPLIRYIVNRIAVRLPSHAMMLPSMLPGQRPKRKL